MTRVWLDFRLFSLYFRRPVVNEAVNGRASRTGHCNGAASTTSCCFSPPPSRGPSPKIPYKTSSQLLWLSGICCSPTTTLLYIPENARSLTNSTLILSRPGVPQLRRVGNMRQQKTFLQPSRCFCCHLVGDSVKALGLEPLAEAADPGAAPHHHLESSTQHHMQELQCSMAPPPGPHASTDV